MKKIFSARVNEFVEYCKRYEQDINRYTEYMMRGQIEGRSSEDLKQEALLKAFEHFNSFSNILNDKKDPFKHWIFKIIQNTYITWFQIDKNRKEKIEENFDNIQIKNNYENFDNAILNEQKRLIVFALRKLSRQGKKRKSIINSVILYFYTGLTYEQIAKRKKIPIGTVRSQIYRGKKIILEEIIKNL